MPKPITISSPLWGEENMRKAIRIGKCPNLFCTLDGLWNKIFILMEFHSNHVLILHHKSGFLYIKWTHHITYHIIKVVS